MERWQTGYWPSLVRALTCLFSHNSHVFLSVDVNVTSIATFLPSSTEHDDAPFAGTTSRAPAVPYLTPAQEAAVRADQVEKQTKDADNRNIVWAVESKDLTDDADADAEGDDDPDYDLQADGSYVRRVARLHETRMVPIGLRNDSGEIEPITVPVQMDVDEMHFGGVSQSVPTRLDEMVRLGGLQVDARPTYSTTFSLRRKADKRRTLNKPSQSMESLRTRGMTPLHLTLSTTVCCILQGIVIVLAQNHRLCLVSTKSTISTHRC